MNKLSRQPTSSYSQIKLHNHAAKLLIHNANTVLVLVDGLVASPLAVDEAPWHQTAHKQRNAQGTCHQDSYNDNHDNNNSNCNSVFFNVRLATVIHCCITQTWRARRFCILMGEIKFAAEVHQILARCLVSWCLAEAVIEAAM